MFVITGGGSGIGAALTKALVLRNQPVLIVGRNAKRLEAVSTFSQKITYCVADIATSSGRAQLLKVLRENPRISGLVHNAGVIQPIQSLDALSLDIFREVMAINFEAPFALNQALLSTLEGAKVLHIGSGAAHFPVAGWAPYCVSKAALWMLVRCFQLENPLVFFGSVMPGIVDTAMQAVIRQDQHLEVMQPEKHAFFQTLFQEKKLLSSETVALFLSYLLLDLDNDTFISKEWDIYDKEHHPHWLTPPHTVPIWEDLE